MTKGRTILMNVFDSNMVRNIMRTDVLKTMLAAPDVARIIILVHKTKIAAYRAEFADPKIVIEEYPTNFPSRIELFAWFLARHIIHTRNVRMKIPELYDRARGSWPARTGKYLLALVTFYASKIPLFDWLIRRFIIAAYDEHLFDELMERHAPDFVFFPTIFGNNDVRLLKYCIRHGIPNVGMIKSWDNLLGKDPLLIWPDRLIVHNELVEGYAMSMHNYPEDRIFVGGIPQFDVYADPDFPTPRDRFFAEMKLDPNKRLILYSCMGGWISLHEREMIEILADVANNSSELIEPSQLLVRLHPAYRSEDNALEKIPNIVVRRPGIPSAERNPERFDFEFHTHDTRELAATLKWSDVILNSGSTMAIDAVCFDLPVINIAFDGYAEHEKYSRSAKRLLDKDHYLPVIRSGGVRVAHNRKEMVEQINMYLADRFIDHEGRMRIVREQCYKLDGKSGKRIGDYIVNAMRELIMR